MSYLFPKSGGPQIVNGREDSRCCAWFVVGMLALLAWAVWGWCQ